MTNYEKIKQMSVEEMAEFILDEFRVGCDEQCANNDYYGECRYCIKEWLESEWYKNELKD